MMLLNNRGTTELVDVLVDCFFIIDNSLLDGCNMYGVYLFHILFT